MAEDAELKVLLAIENNYYERLLELEISKRYPNSTILFARSLAEMQRIVSNGQLSLAIFDSDNTDVTISDYLEICRHINPESELMLLTSREVEIPVKISSHLLAKQLIHKDKSFPGPLPLMLNKLSDKNSGVTSPEIIEHIIPEAEIETVTTGMISHEINNPLMSILGLCELILDEPELDPSEVQAKIRMIQKSARRIKAVLRKMNRSNHHIINNSRLSAHVDTRESTT